MNEPPKILIVSLRYPYPPLDGRRVRDFNLFKHLTSGYHFDLLSFGTPELLHQHESLKKTLGPCFCDVELVPHETLMRLPHRSFLSKLWNIYFPFYSSYYPNFSHVMAQRIREKVATGNYDLVYFCGFAMFLHASVEPIQIPLIVDICDSISLLKQSYFDKEKTIIKKMRSYAEYLWAKRYEQVHCSRVRNIITISPVDALNLRRHCPDSKLWVLPNGVDTSYFQSQNPPEQTNNTLLFTGVMDYPPNNEAMLYFIEEVFPRVKEKIPAVTLTVAGRNPAPELTSLADLTPGVSVTGFVDDIRPYFDASSLYVSPLISGAGMKNKILEAWSMSKPVVATPVSCSGLEVRDNENILIADSPHKFAERIIGLLSDRSLMLQIGRNGRQTAEQSYSWASRASTLADIFAEVLQDR